MSNISGEGTGEICQIDHSREWKGYKWKWLNIPSQSFKEDWLGEALLADISASYAMSYVTDVKRLIMNQNIFDRVCQKIE